jgi:hypothetical protein
MGLHNLTQLKQNHGDFDRCCRDPSDPRREQWPTSGTSRVRDSNAQHHFCSLLPLHRSVLCTGVSSAYAGSPCFWQGMSFVLVASSRNTLMLNSFCLVPVPKPPRRTLISQVWIESAGARGQDHVVYVLDPGAVCGSRREVKSIPFLGQGERNRHIKKTLVCPFLLQHYSQ